MSKKFFLELSERLGLVRSAYVESNKARHPAQAEFYIDTGSPVSVLSPELCERMQIPVKKLDFDEKIAIGGAFVDVAVIDPVKLTFYSEASGDHTSVKVPIYVSDYSSSVPEDVVDNILGMTFFANTGLDLVVENDDSSRGMTAYMEKK